VTFGQETQVEPATLIRYVQRNSRTHRLDGGVKLRFVMRLEKDEQRFAAAEELLTELAKKPAPEVVKAAEKRRERR
jgi:transcription-repair coupling factor (superfamily II helicase)